MTNFMTHKHVVHLTTCLIPNRKSQDTGLNIELCCFNMLMLHHQVFSSKQFGKLRLDFAADAHGLRFVWNYDKTKGRPSDDPYDAF